MFDAQALAAALAVAPRVVRVVLAEVKGSSPREVGAAMLVWPGGQSGTIGGGALEYAAAEGARGGTMDRRGSDMVAWSLGRIGAIYAGAREESVMRV